MGTTIMEKAPWEEDEESSKLDTLLSAGRGAIKGASPILGGYYDSLLEKISGKEATKKYLEKMDKENSVAGGVGYGAGTIASLMYGPKELEILYDLAKVSKLSKFKGLAKTGIDTLVGATEGFLANPGDGGLEKRLDNAKDMAKLSLATSGGFRLLQAPFKKQAANAAFDALNASESALAKIPESQRTEIGQEFLDRGVTGWFKDNKQKLKKELFKEKKGVLDSVRQSSGELPKKEMYSKMGKELRGTILNPERAGFNENLSKFLKNVEEGFNPTEVNIGKAIYTISKKSGYSPMEAQSLIEKANKKYNSKIADLLEDPFKKTWDEVQRKTLRSMQSENIEKTAGKEAKDVYEKSNRALHNLLTGKNLIKEKGQGLLATLNKNKFELGALGLGLGSRFLPEESRGYGTAGAIAGLGLASALNPRIRAKVLTGEPAQAILDLRSRVNNYSEKSEALEKAPWEE